MAESLLSRIASPADLKKLRADELPRLAREIRALITETVGRNGGHLASSLGAVEIAIALHRVFDSPRDAIVWDVGHQSYAHKILTGRAGLFQGLRRKGGISGFPRRSESPHDAFDTGHASTSISAALGILEAKRRQGLPGHAVAVIGDGAMTGGMAYEALCHAGQLQRGLIIVLNDNQMSISPNVGAFSRYLSRLTATRGYQTFRGRVDRFILSLDGFGRHLASGVNRLKRVAKAIFFRTDFFSELGFEYVGPLDGHDLRGLARVFAEVKRIGRPTVVHVVTRKGKGFRAAEADPTAYHGVSPVRVSDGEVEPRPATTFTEAFSDALMAAAARDGRVVAVTAAMAKGTGLSAFQERWPERFYDVGIAEQHALTFAAGMASQGLRPVVAVYSTFAQRAYDQILHDIALQGLPVTICMDRAGPVGEDGETHQGLYDVAFLRCLPGLSILAPASARELGLCLDWALESGGPAAIRYPKCPVPAELPAFAEPLRPGRGVFLRRGYGPLLIVSMGGLVPVAEEALDALALEGLTADHYALRFLKPIDEAYFLDIVSRYRGVLLVEEGVGPGGAGEGLRALAAMSLPGLPMELAAFPDAILPQMRRDELLAEAGLSADALAGRLRGMARRERVFSVLPGGAGAGAL
jgi:1-deoxy-D-xylulose-5-phosphate synthase